MKDKYKIIKQNEKYYIEVDTEEFGYVLLLKKDAFEPLEFNSESDALTNLKTINKHNSELCL